MAPRSIFPCLQVGCCWISQRRFLSCKEGARAQGSPCHSPRHDGWRPSERPRPRGSPKQSLGRGARRPLWSRSSPKPVRRTLHAQSTSNGTTRVFNLVQATPPLRDDTCVLQFHGQPLDYPNIRHPAGVSPRRQRPWFEACPRLTGERMVKHPQDGGGRLLPTLSR